MRKAKTLPTADDPIHIANGFYLTKAQVAHRWGVIHQTVQQWIDKGWLSSVQIPGLGHVINVQELEGFVPPKRGRKPARPPAESSSPTKPGRRSSSSHKPRQIARTVSIGKLSETSHSDAAYWRALPPAQRVIAVEEIKQEFYGEAYTSQSRLARVLRGCLTMKVRTAVLGPVSRSFGDVALYVNGVRHCGQNPRKNRAKRIIC